MLVKGTPGRYAIVCMWIIDYLQSVNECGSKNCNNGTDNLGHFYINFVIKWEIVHMFLNNSKITDNERNGMVKKENIHMIAIL